MRLLRVQVPEFRALKDVDISFEPDFTPQVFPLGSLNGGGKSTLLQLIFVLLHCSADEERHQFIANMLESVTIPESETSRLLAKFELQEGKKKFELEFTICNDGYLKQLDTDIIYNKDNISFNIFSKITALYEKHKSLTHELDLVRNNDNNDRFNSFHNGFKEQYVITAFKGLMPSEKNLPNKTISTREQNIREKIRDTEKNISQTNLLIHNIEDCLESKKQFYFLGLDNYSKGLLLGFSNIEIDSDLCKQKLLHISKSIFLSSPVNQVYLFLDKKDRNRLFSNQKDHLNSYESCINQAKAKLSNFVTYDVFSPDIFIKLFEKARDKDFKEVVKTGKHGNNYANLINELKLFSDKTIIPDVDESSKMTGIIFKSDKGINLYPEDLSHGEFKRLCIYAWLKNIPEGENIVLMDEIENGFHLDWQYTIVRNLIEWGKNNQYILATHSYELCTAVTPAHVKEIEPKLTTK